MKLFSLNESRGWALKLARELQTDIASHEERSFDDGEFKIRALDEVRGEHVFVCESLAADASLSVSDKLCRLAFFCGSLRDAGAERVTAVVPYLAFWRKDRRTKANDPVTTRYVARMLEAVGVDGLLTLEVHSPAALDNAFSVPTESLESAPLFATQFAPLAGAEAKLVVLSPDAGGTHRAHAFASLLEARTGRSVAVALMDKQRSEGRVTGDLFAGDVRDADVIVFDDMIASGATIARAAAAAHARGARGVHAVAAHGVLAPGAVATLNGAGLASLTFADSVGDERGRSDGLRVDLFVLDCAPVFARAIERWTARPERGERCEAADGPSDEAGTSEAPYSSSRPTSSSSSSSSQSSSSSSSSSQSSASPASGSRQPAARSPSSSASASSSGGSAASKSRSDQSASAISSVSPSR